MAESKRNQQDNETEYLSDDIENHTLKFIGFEDKPVIKNLNGFE